MSRARVPDGATDGSQALVGVRDRRDVEAHRVDAHRGERLCVVLDPRELPGVEGALRIGQCEPDPLQPLLPCAGVVGDLC